VCIYVHSTSGRKGIQSDDVMLNTAKINVYYVEDVRYIVSNSSHRHHGGTPVVGAPGLT
jgi:hypothetical protein